MKKRALILFAAFFIYGTAISFAGQKDLNPFADGSVVPLAMEEKMSEKETIGRLVKRVEEIRDMDKSNLTLEEKRELKSELKAIKKNVQKRDATIVIGGSTLLIVILILLLI